jgi:amidase
MSAFMPKPLPVAPQRLQPHDFSPFKVTLDSIKPELITMLDALISGKTLHQLQLLVADKQIEYSLITIYYLWRIREYDPHLNSFIWLNPSALKAAFHADFLRKARADMPAPNDLFGLPIALKDNIATDDMPNTAGAVALRDVLPKKDAFITRNLRESGAIILGKLNMSEWARFMSTSQPNGFSALGGQTKNPYGDQYDTCGSSSGSAVAVSAGLVPVSIGTETSGSIICPAGFNAVIGLKPSLGLVSRDLIIPITDAQDTAGVMALHMEDIATVMNIICREEAEEDDYPPVTKKKNLYSTNFLDTDGLKGKRVGLIQAMTEADIANNPEWSDDDRAKLRANLAESVLEVESIAQRLMSAGASVVPLHIKDVELDLIFSVLEYGLREGVNAYLKQIGSSLTLAQIIADNQADAPTRIPYGQNFLEDSQNNALTAQEYDALVQKNRQEARERLDMLLAQHGLDFIVSRNSEMSTVAAMAGYPLLAVPGGYRLDGMPFGVTFMGRFLGEGALMRAGYAYSKTGKPLRHEPILPIPTPHSDR